ncbi:MAG: phage portal protein [Opitutaceae bacterium]|jgi:SPP1 gp7 family putative phage head morphogenesis protein|nr:phage portal protein [Opitutaceae bacterium]
MPSFKNKLRGLVLRSLGLGEFARNFLTGADVDGVANRAARLTQPYRQSAWVRAAINFVTGEIASRPLKFYDGETEFGDDAFLDWWDAPALGPDASRTPLADAAAQLAAWAKLHGEFFLLLDEPWALATVRTARPAALAPFVIAHPARVRLIIQAAELAGYEYIDAGGRRHLFTPAQVVHWKNFNPYDPWRGLGDLDAALIAAEAAHATGVYVRDLMRNNNDQGYIVIGKNGVASDEQQEQVTAALRAKRAALARGEARDLFLTGELTVERAQPLAAGADLNAGKALSHQEIFVALGVPPSMAEVKASYSIGAASDRYQLITGTCMALAERIAGALAAIASRMAGRVLDAEFDWDDHPVMVEARASRVDTALKLWGAGMPMQKINDYLGLGMAPYPGWGTGYLPFSVAPAAGAGEEKPNDPAQNPDYAEDDADAAADDDDAGDTQALALRLAVLARSRRAAPVCAAPDPLDAQFACACHAGAGVTMKARPPREVAQWRALMAARRETVASFKSAFGRALMAARKETLAKLDRAEKSPEGWFVVADAHLALDAAARAKAAAADLLFDLENFSALFLDAMERQQTAALDKAGKQLFREIGRDDPFRYPPPAAVQFIRERQNRLADVPGEIHAQIKAALEEGLNAGETMAQLSARVRAAFNGIDHERATRIAMTETGAAYGASREEAMRQAGVKYKRWLTSGNDNVRPAHAAANGQTVRADENFIVDGEELAFPSDTRGSPGNVINCHCVAIAVAPDELE